MPYAKQNGPSLIFGPGLELTKRSVLVRAICGSGPISGGHSCFYMYGRSHCQPEARPKQGQLCGRWLTKCVDETHITGIT